jgi:WD40 repeat protein
VLTVGQQRVAIWSVRTGALLVALQGSPTFVGATFTPNSRAVLTAGNDNVVRRYACDVCGGIDELRAVAKDRLAGRP